jgi:hypothetical protein
MTWPLACAILRYPPLPNCNNALCHTCTRPSSCSSSDLVVLSMYFVSCSELQNLANADDSFAAAAVSKLTGGETGSGHPATVVLVIARQGKGLTVEEIESCVKLLNKLTEAGVIEKGAASTERGEKKRSLHLQCCLWLPAVNRNKADVRAAFISLVYEHGKFAGTRRHVHAVVHEPGAEPHVTWRTQCGYVACPVQQTNNYTS